MSALASITAAVVLGVAATVTPVGAVQADAEYTTELLGKAQPDECFNGIGAPYPAGPPCATGQPKVNQSYVWGMTKVGTDVWFGTGANTLCLTSGSSLNAVDPVVNSDYTCEYAESQVVASHPNIPAALGDMRPPQVWLYDSNTKSLANKSAEISAGSEADALRLRGTLGLRAAGNFNGVVLFAGPAASTALNVFAFDAVSKQFLGSRTFVQYGNARTFLAAAGNLYLGVGIGPNGTKSGAVLRWTGNVSKPFAFERVATLPAQAADLAYYDGRIAATTWSSVNATSDAQIAGVWTSPPLPLDSGDVGSWTQVFNAGQYETDPLIKRTYGLGGVASYGGYLYWGTMHVPLKSTKAHQVTYPQTTDDAKKAQIRFSTRTTSIWRGKDLGTPNQKIELLYGESVLPAYNPDTATWSGVPTGWTALYGKSGFGYPFNNYTWRMMVAGDRLYVATMDWSYIVHDLSSTAAPTDPASWGADLWMFPSTTDKAVPISTTGFGNYLNYGIRNMVADGDGLYLGMANPMNLRTDPTDAVPEGGWELIKLNRSPA
jgi:hypothetical protein